jgi:autotransporter-associated beta strand protein
VFGASARTGISASSYVGALELRFESNAPAYRFTIVDGGLYLDLAGVDNESTSTRPEFDIGEGRVLQIEQGSLADSMIVNAGHLDPSNPDDADMATVVNLPDSDIDISYLSSIMGATETSLGSLSGTGDVHLGHYLLTLGKLGRDDEFDGVLADGGALGGTGGAVTKTGNGTLRLVGASTYTGKTTVESGTLDVEGDVSHSYELLVDSGATLAGGGHVGNIGAQANSKLVPGNADDNSSLTIDHLICAPSPSVFARIGNDGLATAGTYLTLSSDLLTGYCPHLNFHFESDGRALVVGQTYTIVIIHGSTNYTADYLGYSFADFPGYRQASGHFVVVASTTPGITIIGFTVDGLGDSIFGNGFELFN